VTYFSPFHLKIKETLIKPEILLCRISGKRFAGLRPDPHADLNQRFRK